MRLDTAGPRDATWTTAVLAATRNQAPLLEVPRWLRRAAGVVGDLLALIGIVLCFPFVILAVGIPIALCVRLLLWMIGVL